MFEGFDVVHLRHGTDDLQDKLSQLIRICGDGNDQKRSVFGIEIDNLNQHFAGNALRVADDNLLLVERRSSSFGQHQNVHRKGIVVGCLVQTVKLQERNFYAFSSTCFNVIAIRILLECSGVSTYVGFLVQLSENVLPPHSPCFHSPCNSTLLYRMRFSSTGQYENTAM